MKQRVYFRVKIPLFGNTPVPGRINPGGHKKLVKLTEEEKSEWAMDIAYDMDEFFRQHDPQYAAEHPEEHAAKEEIYENLMAGRISALDEKLAALGQTQEDYNMQFLSG